MLQFLHVLPMTCEYNSYPTVSWFMIYAVIAKPARVHFVQILVLFFIINPSNHRHSKSLQLRDMPHAGMVSDKQYEQQAPNDKRRILSLMRHEQSRGAAEFLH